MDATDVSAVLARARQGDSEAFRTLVERHSRRAFQLAFRIAGNEQDAEDVVQESFIRAYRQLSRFEARAHFATADLQNDEELKLLALRGVMQADPDKGVPIIEKMLAGGASPRVRGRALFVLAQRRSARAREVMLSTAKNNANPDLQRTAIRY